MDLRVPPSSAPSGPTSPAPNCRIQIFRILNQIRLNTTTISCLLSRLTTTDPPPPRSPLPSDHHHPDLLSSLRLSHTLLSMYCHRRAPKPAPIATDAPQPPLVSHRS
ncbi:uncharacterized protein LOC131313803 [Rhododendron vialii]|uniref:uncharacterized protein LOC131313803 n=1 Tax=Rhododendron vialii TaxID=182163 RepID=UPI00265E8E2F|nr:uncharacterized protein LOC131313803 [Rhododendron vialii]